MHWTLTLMLLWSTLVSGAEYPAPSAAEIAACTPDAMVMCVSHTGFDRRAVFECLRAHRTSLRPACRRVFEKHHL